MYNTFDLEISRLECSRLSQPTNSLFGVAIAGNRAQPDDTVLLVDRPLFPVGLNHSRLAFGSSNDIPLRLITCSLVFALAKRTHYMLCDVRFGKYSFQQWHFILSLHSPLLPLPTLDPWLPIPAWTPAWTTSPPPVVPDCQLAMVAERVQHPCPLLQCLASDLGTEAVHQTGHEAAPTPLDHRRHQIG